MRQIFDRKLYRDDLQPGPRVRHIPTGSDARRERDGDPEIVGLADRRRGPAQGTAALPGLR